MKLRIGIVGLGRAWQSCHGPALRALADRFEVRAVCDPIAHRADEVARQWSARASESFHQLIGADDIDAVLFLSADWYGPLPIFAACDAGKAIYCGATLDISTQDGAEVHRRVRAAGVAFMAEFPYRLAPATLRLKELMATRLGPPRLLFCNQWGEGPGVRGEMPERQRPPGMRSLIEMVDWCRDLVGTTATSVLGTAHQTARNASASAATASSQDSPISDYLSMTLDFSPQDEAGTGPVAQIACGRYTPEGWREAASFRRPADLQIVCQHGIAFLDLPNRLVWFDTAGQHTESLDHDRPVGEQLFLHFHRQVGSLVLKTASLEDAYRALMIVNRAQESDAQGKKLRIADLGLRI